MKSVKSLLSCGTSHNDNIINIIHHDIGEKVYNNILKEFTSDRYVEEDFRDLAKELNVFHYYYDNLMPKHGDDKNPQIKRRRHRSKSQNYISTSGILIHKIFERWAMEYPHKVAKKTLYIAFCEIPSMRHMVKLLEVDYDYDCEIPHVCQMTKMLEVGHDQVMSEEDTSSDDISSAGMYPFIHLNLRHGRFTAEKVLGDKSEGTYLVRPSQNRLGDYSISLKLKDRTAHIRIEAVATKMGTKYGRFESRRYTGSPEEEDNNLFLTLGDLINHFTNHDIFANQKLTHIIMPPTTEKEDLTISSLTPTRNPMQTPPDKAGGHTTESPKQPVFPLPPPPRNKQYLKENTNWEHLQKLINLKDKDKLNLPTVSMIIKATCLIEYDGAEGDWRGTAFLGTIHNFPGVVLFSAGHIFWENGKIIQDFDKVLLSFNNPEGLRSKPSKNIHSKNNIMRVPLSKFLKPKSTMVITIYGEQLIIRGQNTSTKSVDIHLDYFALVLEDPFEKVKLKEVMGLDFLPCAKEVSLVPNIGEPLVCFGHPFVEKLGGKGKENRQNNEMYPMRFSHGNEKKLEDNGLFTDEYKKQRFFYDLDTQGGSSGCEVIGRNYTVKGIHIGKISGHQLNAAQPIRAVLRDLEQLGVINQ